MKSKYIIDLATVTGTSTMTVLYFGWVSKWEWCPLAGVCTL